MNQPPSSAKQRQPEEKNKAACNCSKQKSCRQHPNPARVLQEMAHEPQSTDVLGSYTGTPADGGLPQQDADDL